MPDPIFRALGEAGPCDFCPDSWSRRCGRGPCAPCEKVPTWEPPPELARGPRLWKLTEIKPAPWERLVVGAVLFLATAIVVGAIARLLGR